MADESNAKQSYFSSQFGNLLRHPVGDLIGGITAAVIALPLALAFGVASGLGATAGLYGAIACGIIAALFGGTRGQVSGPTGPMTVVTASLFLAVGGTGSPDAARLVFAAVILAGGLQILLGVFRLGQLIHYIPYPVISGFMTGIGVIIVILQVPVMFGLEGKGGVIEILGVYRDIPSKFNLTAAGIGVCTLIVIVLLKRFVPRLPGALVAMLAATIATLVFGLDVPKIGPIPGGLPTPRIPEVGASQLRMVGQAAVALALLGAIDSLLTSVVVDRLTSSRHNSNRELVGQGLGNLAAGLIGGLPGAGATMRSVVNINSGGRTNLSGIIHGSVLLGVLLGLGALTADIPLACLAGILIHVGITIVDYRGLKSIRRAPRGDTAVMVVVFGLTVFVDLIVAVVVGIAMASVLFAKKLSDARTSNHGPLSDENLPADFPEALKGTIYQYTFTGPLYFGEAKNFGEVMSHILRDSSARIRHVVLVFDNPPLIDQTGAFAVEDTIERLQARGFNVYLVHPSDEVREKLERIATRPVILQKTYFERMDTALQAIASQSASN